MQKSDLIHLVSPVILLIHNAATIISVVLLNCRTVRLEAVHAKQVTCEATSMQVYQTVKGLTIGSEANWHDHES